nr:IRK-interacting protein-like [Ipomoea batatas]
MDSVDQPVVTASKSKLARTFAKVMHIRAVASSVHGNQRSKSHEKVKNDVIESDFLKSMQFNICDEEDKMMEKLAMEAFIAKLFASISAVKAAYAELQYAQSPYDPDGIRAADQMVVSELKSLSELKQCFLKKQIEDYSPESSLVLAEIHEQKSIIKTYEVMGKKLDSQVRLKDSEITFLKEKLEEANKETKIIEKRLNSSGQLSVPDNLHFSGLNPCHFITILRQATKSIRNFVRLLSREMESSGWDLDLAASAIVPRVSFWQVNHKCYAFESFVCREMFEGFNAVNFSVSREPLPEGKKLQRLLFDRFKELKSVKPGDYLAWKPKSTFARFCCKKYLRLIHPRMEQSLFGNLDQRSMVKSGEYPETTFFSSFSEMAKRIWLLHCLAFSFDPEASIFQVSRGSRFSDVYMESMSDEAFLSSEGTPETQPRVAFTVMPGFRIGKTVIQAQVYLR